MIALPVLRLGTGSRLAMAQAFMHAEPSVDLLALAYCLDAPDPMPAGSMLAAAPMLEPVVARWQRGA